MKRWWAVAFAFFFCACLAAARITLAADAPDTDNGDTSATDNGDAKDPGDDTTAAMPPDAGAAARRGQLSRPRAAVWPATALSR